MERMNLQLFGSVEPVQGKKIVYLFRVMADEATTNAQTIAFTTENSTSISKDADTTETKDGMIRTPGAMEVEISVTAILAKGDAMYDRFREAMRNDEIIEIWEANLEEPSEAGENKFKGTYYQGYLTEFEKTSSAEDHVECSTTFGINGAGVDGDVTVSAKQQEIASYAFRDTQKTGA